MLLFHCGQQAFGLIAEAIESIDGARTKGLSVTGEGYPYNFSYTSVAADNLQPDSYERNMDPTHNKATGKRGKAWDTLRENMTGRPCAAETHDKVLAMVRERNLRPLMRASTKTSYLKTRLLEDNGVTQVTRMGWIAGATDADVAISILMRLRVIRARKHLRGRHLVFPVPSAAAWLSSLIPRWSETSTPD